MWWRKQPVLHPSLNHSWELVSVADSSKASEFSLTLRKSSKQLNWALLWKAYFRVSLCFIPPPSRTLVTSLPVSGLHRHLSASLSPYVSGVLFCQSLGEGTWCHSTPGSPGWECSLSQVNPAGLVTCHPSVSGCREPQVPGHAPCLLTHGPFWLWTLPSHMEAWKWDKTLLSCPGVNYSVNLLGPS